MSEIKCLDKGFVRLVDHMGDDSRIVQAARVSYGKGTKTVNEDKGLIDYLVRHRHTSPLEMVNFTFHCKMPIFVARQWVRHRTAKLNEISGRYSEMEPEFYVPDPDRMQSQSTDNKQGSSGELIETWQDVRMDMTAEQENSYDAYKSYLTEGLAKELARINLPLSLYTEWYWTMDLHNLFHFINLRSDPHAQYEIRVYSDAILELIKPIVPYAVESFERHIKGAISFGEKEKQILAKLSKFVDVKEVAEEMGLSPKEVERFVAKVTLGKTL